MTIYKFNELVTVVFSDGTTTQTTLSEEDFKKLCLLEDENEAKMLMNPDYRQELKDYHEFKSLDSLIEESTLLKRKGDSIYWDSVSQLSMPMELVKSVIEAENEGNEERVTAYKNFWTLMSLNPDSRCRQNLFWFLQKYGMKISKYGLFVGYRNADLLDSGQEEEQYSQELISFVKESYNKIKHQKQSPKRYMVDMTIDYQYKLTKSNLSIEGHHMCLFNLYNYFNERNWDYDLINPNTEKVYTDHHSHTFKIKIGEKVTMPREKCDSVQDHSCSSGLHIGGQTWLSENYFGDTGLICLVNPADVVAVPPIDNYGKLRTCAYLPIGEVKFNSEGKVIPYNLEDGFNSEYVKEVLYNGKTSTEKDAAYKIVIPDIPELDTANIFESIKSIAEEAIKDRIVE